MHGDILELDPNFRTIFEYEFLTRTRPVSVGTGGVLPVIRISYWRSVEGFVRWDWLDILGRTKKEKNDGSKRKFPAP
jgi:hypothetical protein